jgi:anti-anti-sigma factor
MKIMEVTKIHMGDVLEVSVRGRLDGHWADHLRDVLLEEIREGAHKIRLNAEALEYISSAGLGALIEIYQRMAEIHGSFSVYKPTKPVLRVIQLSGVEHMFIPGGEVEALSVVGEPKRLQMDQDHARFEVFDCVQGATLHARLIGRPGLQGHGFKEACLSIHLPETVMALGLGAFGDEFSDCSPRFGEFLAAAGAAAYQPTDGSSIPDFNVSAAAFVPVMNVLYALVCEGSFAHAAHFERKKEAGPISLSDLVTTCLEISGSDAAGMVVVAESAGLLGASLRKSPALQKEVDPFVFPEVRDWLSFSPEHIHARSMVLATGVAIRSAQPSLQSFVRPLWRNPFPAGHFHAASFSYRPLKKGETDLRKTVANLFEAESLEGVLHLMCDDREIAGAGQSQFIRGACWIAPITRITVEE